MSVDVFEGFLFDVACRIKLFGDRRAIGLGGDIVVVELIVAVAQVVGVGAFFLEAGVVLAADVILMLGAQVNVLKAVEWQVEIIGLA